MSTYTDLHNKVKESVVVNYHKGFDDDRVTFQEVKLLNPNNQYRGTFSGTMNVENTTIADSEISGGVIHHVEMHDVIWPGGKEVDKCMGMVEAISNDVNFMRETVIPQIKDATEKESINRIESDERLCSRIDIQDERINTLSNVVIPNEFRVLSNNFSNKIDADILLLSSDICHSMYEISNNLSASISQNDNYISSKVDELSNNVSAEVIALSTSLSNTVTKNILDLSTNLSTEVSILSGRVIAEETARFENDKYLSAEIDSLSTRLSTVIALSAHNLCCELFAEETKRAQDDADLNHRIDVEINERSTHDNELHEKINSHIQDNIDTFNSLSDTVDNKILHDKHYEYNIVPANAYLAKLKDFATNILTVDVATGDVIFIKEVGDKHISVHVGKIETPNNELKLPITIITDNDITERDPALAVAIDNNAVYHFENSFEILTHKNGYKLQLKYDTSATSINDLQIIVQAAYSSFHDIWTKNTEKSERIGKVTSTYPTGDCNDILSGIYYIEDNIQLKDFAGYSDMFNTTDLSIHSYDNGKREIIYHGNNTFAFKNNIVVTKYINVKDIGMIYDYHNNLSGIEYDIEKHEISGINIYPVGYSIGAIKLERSTFDNLVQARVLDKDDSLEYDIRLSADPKYETTAKFELYGSRKLYKYNAYASESPYATTKGYIVPDILNKKLFDVSLDICNTIFVKGLNNEDLAVVPDLIKDEYELQKVDDYWHCELTAEQHSQKLTIKVKKEYNKYYLAVKTQADEYTKEFGQWPIDTTDKDPDLDNPDTWRKSYVVADDVDLTKFESHREPGSVIELTIDEHEDSTAANTYTLNVTDEDVKTAYLQIPSFTDNTIAREFKIVCNAKDNVELKLVDADKNLVKYFLNKKPYIPVKKDTWTTFQVNEVRRNHYLVNDINDNPEHKYLDELSACLSNEIKTRTEQVEFLSTEHDALSISLSTDISSLNAEFTIVSNDLYELSAEFEDISADFNERISANTSNIIDLYKQIHGQLNFKGVLNLDATDKFAGSKNPPIHDTISALFINNIIENPEGHIIDEALSVKLRNGFYFVADATENPLSTFVFEGLKIQKKDWIIIKENTAVSNITAAKVAIFDAQDVDVFHLSADGQVVNGTTEFYKQQTFHDLSAISEFADQLTATTLSANAISANTGVINHLTCDLTLSATDLAVNSLSANEFQATSATISSLTSVINAAFESADINVENVTSAFIDNENVSVLTVEKSTTTNADISTLIANDQTVDRISAFELTADNAKISNEIALNLSADNANVSNEIALNLSVDNAKISNEIALNLSVDNSNMSSLTANNIEVDNLTAYVLSTVETSATRLSATSLTANEAKISTEFANDVTINKLSAYNLTADNSFLSNAAIISATITSAYISNDIVGCLSVSSLSRLSVLDRNAIHPERPADPYEISSLQDILDLSVDNLDTQDKDISSYIWDKHYGKSLSTDIKLTKPSDPHLTEVVDQLLIRDEITFNVYRLTIRNGALNINIVKEYDEV